MDHFPDAFISQQEIKKLLDNHKIAYSVESCGNLIEPSERASLFDSLNSGTAHRMRNLDLLPPYTPWHFEEVFPVVKFFASDLSKFFLLSEIIQIENISLAKAFGIRYPPQAGGTVLGVIDLSWIYRMYEDGTIKKENSFVSDKTVGQCTRELCEDTLPIEEALEIANKVLMSQ